MKKGPLVTAGLLCATWIFAVPSAAESRKEVAVRCGTGETVGLALSKLDKLAPITLAVSGTCQENVVIRGFNDLRIVGKPGATLVPVDPPTAYGIEVATARAVSIEGLTIRVTDGRPAMVFAACQDCRVKNVTVDGGIGFYAWDWSYVSVSGLKVTGAGGGAWTAVGAWKAMLYIEDSVFEDTGGTWNSTRWCGLCIGQSAVATLIRSTVRNFGVGITADTGASVFAQDSTTVEDNWCYGILGTNGGHIHALNGSQVLNNSATCWSGGINLDFVSTLRIQEEVPGMGHVLVKGNTGGGIKLNHQASAQLAGGAVVSSNNGPGLEVRNLSMAVAPGPGGEPQPTVEISGNQWGGDLRCDSLSHINNATRIVGATEVQCTNLWPEDGPAIP